MNKTIVLILLLTIGFISCKNSEKEIDELGIAKKYYEILDKSNVSEIETLLTDSLWTKETEYEQKFSKKEYVEWLKWDSVFEPTYEILRIKQENKIVKAKISKMDKRILFLHEEPMVWNEIIRFDNNKIVKVERIKYEVFNVDRFLNNRDELVKWIDQNHPELNGFIHDQTANGGMKYLKVIELYKKQKNSR